MNSAPINPIRRQLRKLPTVRYFLKKFMDRYKNTAKFYFDNTLQALESIDLSASPKTFDKPQGALIEITNACNLNCLMCLTKESSRPVGLMKPELFERIILELKSVGIRGAGLHTVGETFVYSDLESLFEIVKKHNFLVWISTNAQFPERLEELYTRFPDVLTNIRVSIDGATRDTFEHIRTGASFDKLIESLEVIHSINKGKKNYRILSVINSILNIETLREIPLYFENFKKYVNESDINFSPITGLVLDNAYFDETFPYENLIHLNSPCRLPFTNLYYTFDGKATACCRDYNAELTVGDIKTTSVMDIWNGSEIENIRQKHLNRETHTLPHCHNCYNSYDFLPPVLNNYIHFLRIKAPKLTPKEVENQLLVLLERLNEIMGEKNIPALKKNVIRSFHDCN